MRLTRIALANVRNYAALDFQPAPGLNVFVGRNAQGKSNLLEAISLLGTGKSFRTSRDGDLVREGLALATITGEAELRNGTVRLSCTISNTNRGTRKRYGVNGQPVRYARFLGSVKVVVFVPADLQLITGPPRARRAFLNAALAQDDPAYYRHLARYQKALAQKSALLRGSGEADPALLAIYDAILTGAGTALILARKHFVSALCDLAAAAHARFAPQERLAVHYAPSVPFEVPSEDGVASAFAARLRQAAPQERLRKMTLVGPHRDDLALFLDGKPLAPFGSQGQQRTAVLALKAGEYGVMHDRSGEAPLLLLDDVLSELDPQRARVFMSAVEGYEQAFLTATHVPPAVHHERTSMYRIECAAIAASEAS